MSFNDHQSAQHQLFRMRFTELNEIFAVMSLRSFAVSMIGIFVPIYMYTLGYSLQEIFLLHIIMFFIEFAFELVAAQVISKLGPKHSIALSMPFLVAHFWLLSTVPQYHWPLWLIAAAGGISLALYWQGYNYDFSRSKTKNGATKDISRLYIMLAVLGAIAPFVGGTIATYFGFQALYGVVIGLLMIVFLPLIWFKEKQRSRPLNSGSIKLSDIYRDILAYGGSGMEASVTMIIWPLFVFAIVGTVQKVGIITSLTVILSIMVTYFVGKKVNNGNRHNFVKYGGLVDSLTYIVIIFVDTFGQILSLNFVRALIGSLRSAPFTSEYYLHADERSRSEYILAMECGIDFARISMFSSLFLLTFLLPSTQVLIIGLLFGALGSILTSIMPRAKCERPYCKTNKSIKFIPKLRPKNATN